MKRAHSRGNKEFNPETLALGYGYDPFLSEGAVKPPVFLTSTFQFGSAEEGKRFFELAYAYVSPRRGRGRADLQQTQQPHLEIFERRIAAWIARSWRRRSRPAWRRSPRPPDAARAGRRLALVGAGVRRHALPVSPDPSAVRDRGAVPSGRARDRRRDASCRRGGRAGARAHVVPGDAGESEHDALRHRGRCWCRRRATRDARRRGRDRRRQYLAGSGLPAGRRCMARISSSTRRPSSSGGHSDLVAGVATGPKEIVRRILTYRTILGR